MHDNPQGPSDRAFALDDHAVIALSGPDAVAFAQAQFMSDVAQLGNSHWQWSGWLTPKGRVVALFMLLRIADDQLWLVVPDADAGALAASLSRFVFRSKVKVAVRDDLHVAARFGATAAVGTRVEGEPASAVDVSRGDAEQPRALRISSEPIGADAALRMRWRAADLRAGVPRLVDGQREQWTPQQLSLERLRAFSVRKGCYPGQEIVARTHFLGKAKRGLLLIESEAPLAAGAALHAGDTPIGAVVAVADDGVAHVALAVASLERDAAAALSVAGVAVREAQLPEPVAA